MSDPKETTTGGTETVPLSERGLPNMTKVIPMPPVKQPPKEPK